MTVNELPRWIYCESQPELVEFEDGARDVPFTTVAFLPALHGQNKSRALLFMASNMANKRHECNSRKIQLKNHNSNSHDMKIIDSKDDSANFKSFDTYLPGKIQEP